MIPTLNCYQCKTGNIVSLEMPCAFATVNPFQQTCGQTLGYPTTFVLHFKFPGSQNIIYQVPSQIVGLMQTAIAVGGSFRSGFFCTDPSSVDGNRVQISAYSGSWHRYLINTRPSPNTALLYPMDYEATIPIQGGSCVYVSFASGPSQIWNAFGKPDCASYPDICAIRPPREPYQPPNAIPPFSTNNTIFTGQFIRITFDTTITLADP